MMAFNVVGVTQERDLEGGFVGLVVGLMVGDLDGGLDGLVVGNRDGITELGLREVGELVFGLVEGDLLGRTVGFP